MDSIKLALIGAWTIFGLYLFVGIVEWAAGFFIDNSPRLPPLRIYQKETERNIHIAKDAQKQLVARTMLVLASCLTIGMGITACLSLKVLTTKGLVAFSSTPTTPAFSPNVRRG